MRTTLPSGTPMEIAEMPGATTGLVVIPDIMGLRALFDDLVARLATDNGWTVAAIEPFPDNVDMPLDERLSTGVASLSDDRLLGDAAAAADATGCQTVGVLGFCMGGMFTFKAAGTGRFAKAVAFYGMIRPPANFAGPAQTLPLDYLARDEACPVLAIVGGKDSFTPKPDVDALRATGAEVVVYEDAEHGFVHDPSRPAHRAEDANDAWSRAIAFLRA
jgi:carboxymethylenebutenolidase